ncbi:ATP-binding protein [uncultured Oceanisphaera sp.]|uniref:sensor histidine kinase n=1 Tax=uncultured Oceanisphaera sp. TaxID=353858 RepID=UPI0026391A3B|nr:ATP-binding protein [uncultured Oceanisphaera sp.]
MDSFPASAAMRERSPLILLLLLGMALLAFVLTSSARMQAMEQIREQADANLSRYIVSLQYQLDRHRDLPRLLASQQQLISLLEHPGNAQNIDTANRYLAWVNATMGATDSYVIGTDGITLAASNWDQPHSFIGNDYSFRPYFQQAMEGGAGRYFALGNTSRVRGYFFSYPVLQAGQIIGIVVVKVDLEDIEADWSDPLQDILVMDEDGVIFISTRAYWRFRTLGYLPEVGRQTLRQSYGNHESQPRAGRPPVGPAASRLTEMDVARISASRRYGQAPLLPLDIIRREVTEQGDLLLTLVDTPGISSDRQSGRAGHYLLRSRLLPDAGMRVAVLASLRPLQSSLLKTLGLGLTFYLILAALVLFFSARHRMKQQHQAELQQAHEALELRVKLRTRELTDANQRLQQEMEQHHQTQNQLIQTAKLAVLGQLSAGINHELSQPITAIRHFADNGRKLLTRGRAEAVTTNLAEIAGLADRMAAILQPLREFARPQQESGRSVNLQHLRQGVMVIMGSQLEQQQVDISWPEGLERLWVTGDIGRLEQVLVNLIGNALQAMIGQSSPRIEITLDSQPQWVRLSVRDRGPGLPPDALTHVFEPFYTTKPTGMGLGLSISHRIVHSLNGRLEAANHPQGGALFTLTLPSYSPQEHA